MSQSRSARTSSTTAWKTGSGPIPLATSVATRLSAACSPASRWSSLRASPLAMPVATISVNSARRASIPSGSSPGSDAPTTSTPHWLVATTIGHSTVEASSIRAGRRECEKLASSVAVPSSSWRTMLTSGTRRTSATCWATTANSASTATPSATIVARRPSARYCSTSGSTRGSSVSRSAPMAATRGQKCRRCATECHDPTVTHRFAVAWLHAGARPAPRNSIASALHGEIVLERDGAARGK
jgi:hypothetical protein